LFVAAVISQLASSEARGNPVCWSVGFTYESCCENPDRARGHGCWNLHYSYEHCCLEPYKPSRLCSEAKTPEDQLWHCRARPSEDMTQCLTVDNVGSDGWGIVNVAYKTYEDYVRVQQSRAKLHLEGNNLWSHTAAVIAVYLERHFALKPRSESLRGLCHGAKTGKEIRMLREAIANRSAFTSTALLGTDITEEAVALSGGDVVRMDFHDVRADWYGHWDFIYSNAFDHSPRPWEAVRVWHGQLHKPDGVLILGHTLCHHRNTIDAVDVYGSTAGEACLLLKKNGYEILDVVRIPSFVNGTFRPDDLIFARPRDLEG